MFSSSTSYATDANVLRIAKSRFLVDQPTQILPISTTTPRLSNLLLLSHRIVESNIT